LTTLSRKTRVYGKCLLLNSLLICMALANAIHIILAIITLLLTV
jgi:hypothetical protein